MARPRGNLKAATGRARKQDNLSSLSTEVLRLRLQALNLPITGSKADLVSRLQAVQHPRAAPRTKPGRVQKRSARQRKDRPAESQPAVAVAVDFDGDASEVSSGSSVADLDDLLDFPQSGSRADQETSPSSQPFTETQMAAIQDTVRSSLEQALQSFPFQPTYLTNATPATSNLPQRRPGAATPLGLTRPLDKSLTDKVLRGPSILGSGSQGRDHPLYHPAFAHDPLREEVQTYANWGLAWSTNRTYGSGEKRFIRFCLMNRIMSSEGDILPATEGTLVYFASYLARTVRHSTIKLYLSAVRNLHLSCGHGDPLQGKLLLRKVLRGILRYQGQTRILRQPVTPGVLLAIQPILRTWLGERDFSMIWAAFTLAFFAFLQCSEFTYPGTFKFRPQFDLSADCVSFHPSLACPQQMSIFLKASKTDAFRQGHTLVIACSASQVCAVTAMRNYFLAARPRGPLFVFQSGRLLTRSVVINLLRDAARNAGVPHNSLKGHSFRIGAASTAAAAGMPDWLIKVLGRWSSDCYQLYIRTPRNVLLSAAPRMAGVTFP